MAWRLTAAVAAGVAALAVPQVARACTCWWGAAPLGSADARPANARIAFANCVPDFPAEQLAVTVDDQPASLVIDDRQAGPYTRLLAVDPEPSPGQRVVLTLCEDEPEACRGGVSETFEWVAGEPDRAAPAPSSAFVSATRRVDEPGGPDCPPDREFFRVRFTELDLEPDTDGLWLQVLRGSTPVDGVLYSVDPSELRDAFDVDVYADADPDVCIQAWTFDAAGNAARLGDLICEIRRADSPPELGDVETVDASCGCVAPGAGPSPSLLWLFGVSGIFVARRRRREVPGRLHSANIVGRGDE